MEEAAPILATILVPASTADMLLDSNRCTGLAVTHLPVTSVLLPEVDEPYLQLLGQVARSLSGTTQNDCTNYGATTIDCTRGAAFISFVSWLVQHAFHKTEQATVTSAYGSHFQHSKREDHVELR